MDCSFVTLNLCFLAAIKIEGIGTVGYGVVVLLLKTDDVLEQLGLISVVREGSKPSCSLCHTVSFSFPFRQTRISVKYCKEKAGCIVRELQHFRQHFLLPPNNSDLVTGIALLGDGTVLLLNSDLK